MRKKISVIFLLFFIILLPVVNSATTVTVNQPQKEQKSFLENFLEMFKTKTFWFVLGGFIIIVAFLIIVFLLIRWLIQFIKLRKDIFHVLKVKRIKLAKVHRSYPSSKFFKFKKNTPIRLVKIVNNKPLITEPIAYHKGDYVTHEGNVIIAFNMIGHKKFFFIPSTEILVIPNYDKLTYHDNSQDKPEKIEIKNIPIAKDIIQFNRDEILLYADSISNTGQFHVPVLKSPDGKVIDLSFPIYQKIKNVVIGDFLYEQTEEFSKIAKKSLDINPHLRYATKLGDSSQSVDSSRGGQI